MANEGDAERLVVLLEARIRDFEKNFAKASGTATRSYSGMRRDSRAATAQMERDMLRSTTSINRALAATSTKIGGFGLSFSKGMLAAVAPLIGATAAISKAKQGLVEFGDIADNSKAAGIDADMFQGLAYQAELGGVSIDQLATSLAGFNRNAGLAIENKGRMVAALKALDPELLKNIQSATTQEERIRLAADAIKAQGDEAKRAALSVALFGDAGAKLADVFSGGAAGIAEMSAKARELGMIVDNDLIATADKMGDEFDTATKIMDLQFKQALIELAPFLIGTAKLAGDLARGINYMSESMRSLSDRSTARLEQDYQGIMKTLSQSNEQYDPSVIGAENMAVRIDPEKQAEMQAQADAMRAELKRRAVVKLAGDMGRPRLRSGDDDEDTAGGRNKVAEAALREGEAVKKLIAHYEYERSLIGLSAVEQEKMNALRQAGAAATDEQRAQLTDLIEATAAEQERVEALQDVYGELGEIGMSAINGIIDALDDGKITADEFGDILGNVLSMAGEFFLNSAFSALGGGGGGFNLASLFQKRETGGPVKKGQPYIVGERRPEVFVPDQSGRILPSVSGASGAATSSASLTYAPVIDARGADAGAVARLERILLKQATEFEAKVIRVVRSGGSGRFRALG